MKMNIFSRALICISLAITGCATQPNVQERATVRVTRFEVMKEMFLEMVVKKNASLIPRYYHPKFLLFTNDQQQNYAEMIKFHEKIYQTSIQYSFEFDRETVVEQGDRVAFRVFITTQRPNELPHKIEVVLISQFKDDKIYRIWELTYPDWSKLPAFKK